MCVWQTGSNKYGTMRWIPELVHTKYFIKRLSKISSKKWDWVVCHTDGAWI